MRTITRPTTNPLGAVACGVAASALGTLAMDLLLYRRYRREGGESGLRPVGDLRRTRRPGTTRPRRRRSASAWWRPSRDASCHRGTRVS